MTKLKEFTHLNIKTHSKDTIIGHVIYVDNYVISISPKIF